MTTTDASPQIAEAHCLAVAGSFTIPSGPPVDIGEGKTRTQGWQTIAWDYWHRLGELRYGTGYIARQVTRVNWRVIVNGKELEAPAAEARIDEVTKGLGEDEAARLIALNIEIAGEGWYVHGPDDKYHVYSVVSPGVDEKVKTAQGSQRAGIRFYQADPVDPTLAESAVRAALEPCEELLTLQSLSKAQARSRINAGMLFTPSGQTFTSGDPFGEDLEKMMTLGIRDVSHPSALAPMHVEMDRELIPIVRHLTFERPYDNKINEKIELAIKRLALALDMPPELLLGAGDINHWSLWAISADTYQAHVEPLAEQVGDVFAEAMELLYPTEKIDVIPDASDLLARRSTVADARDGYTAGAVGGSFYRDALGATEDDAPTPEEAAARQPLDTFLPITEIPPIGASLTIEPEFIFSGDRHTEGMIEGAVAMAIDHARAKVGAKLRTKLRGSDDETRLATVPNSQCAATCQDHLSEIDVDGTILEALTPFMGWWESHGFTLPSRQARLAVTTYVSDTIRSLEAEPTPELLTSLGA